MHTLEMSTGLERIFDDMSQTRGTPFVSGTNSNSIPETRRADSSSDNGSAETRNIVEHVFGGFFIECPPVLHDNNHRPGMRQRG